MPHKYSDLRKQAENKLQQMNSESSNTRPDEFKKILHELNVYQIELEMQNEQLRRTQFEIEEQRDKYTNLYDFSPVAYLTLNNNSLIIEANLTACKLFDIERNHLISTSVNNYINNEDKDIFYLLQRELLKSQGQRSCELRIINNNAMEFWARIECMVITDKKSSDLQIRISIENITDRKKAETELQKMQKLESLGVLAGGIAHDFNNLLSGIVGNVELAQMEINDNQNLTTYLARCHKSLGLAADLSGRLLTFAKGGEPQIVAMNIEELLKDTCILALSGTNTTFTLESDPQLKSVSGDVNQLGQVMFNVLLNAHQAMPSPGKIKVTANNTRVQTNQINALTQGEFVEIIIEDCGVGIPQSIIENIFDPFYTTKDSGTGLGLAICHSIIKKHHGEILFESELGQGTIVRILLPTSNDTIQVQAPLEPIEFTMRGQILLMDDNEMIRDVCTDIFNSMGIGVTCTTNGEEAIKSFIQAHEADNPFDVVILDLTVPDGMGGLQAMDEIRKIDKKVPSIVFSGYSDDVVLTTPETHGFNGKLSKPFKKAELTRVLKSVLDK